MVNTNHLTRITCAMVFAAVALATPLAARQGAATAAPPSLQTSLANDVGTLSDKFSGLARVMAGKYDWKPGQGVRSAGDVFNLIVTENKMLTGLLTGTPATPGGAAITDPAQLQQALTSSYTSLKQAVAGLSAADLNASVKMFGRDMTKQAAVLLLIMDQHEHLGQSIAYARSNGVVPPWSK